MLFHGDHFDDSKSRLSRPCELCSLQQCGKKTSSSHVTTIGPKQSQAQSPWISGQTLRSTLQHFTRKISRFLFFFSSLKQILPCHGSLQLQINRDIFSLVSSVKLFKGRNSVLCFSTVFRTRPSIILLHTGASVFAWKENFFFFFLNLVCPQKLTSCQKCLFLH